MRSQVSAELLIVIAALAALAVYVFTQMRSSAKGMSQELNSSMSDIKGIIKDLQGE